MARSPFSSLSRLKGICCTHDITRQMHPSTPHGTLWSHSGRMDSQAFCSRTILN